MRQIHNPDEVRVFGLDGQHLRTFGRDGEGPGEFGDITSLAWVRDRLLACWLAHQAWCHSRSPSCRPLVS